MSFFNRLFWPEIERDRATEETASLRGQVKALQGQVSAHTKSIMALLNRKEEVAKTVSTKPFMVVIPFHSDDFHGALNLLRWIFQLGGCPERTCLLMSDFRIEKSSLDIITRRAKKAFKSVFVESTPHSLPDETWPIGPNFMFQCALEKVRDSLHAPFLWLEPDCVPLRRGWDNAIQKEYDACGSPFMGFVVPGAADGTFPKHLSGWAVYPANAAELILPFVRVDENASHENSMGIPRAWDVESATVTLPLTHHSNLFHHIWGEFKKPPTFDPSKPDALSLDAIPRKAVVLHRCKDGSAITELRKML